MLKIEHCRKLIRSTWKVLKCGDGEGLRYNRVRNKVLNGVKKERNILPTLRGREGQLGWSQLAWELPSKARY